jgi:hypothetical protein
MVFHLVNEFLKQTTKNPSLLFSLPSEPKHVKEFIISLLLVLTMTKMDSPSFTAQFPMVAEVQCVVPAFLLYCASSTRK